MIAGVASGLGRYFTVDPNLVRVAFAVAVVFTGGLALLAYPVMWFLMPEEPAHAPAWPAAPQAAPADPASFVPASDPIWRDPADPAWGRPPQS
jgi:phage shock protein C